MIQLFLSSHCAINVSNRLEAKDPATSEIQINEQCK